jgi:hypothetical protein
VFESGVVKMVQGVREIFEIFDAPDSDTTSAPPAGKIILIGKDLSSVEFEDSFRQAIN